MRILVDIVHPADVHFFKYAIREWENRGHRVLITARDKDIALHLLRAYGFEFKCISSQGRGLWGMASELVTRDLRLFRIARIFRPDVLTGFTGISIAHVGKLLGKPSIVFYDTEFARLSNALTYPLATLVCTPDCYNGQIGKKHLRFPGYKDLAYLHPHRFTPNPMIVREAGIDPESRFFIIRFVSWEAAHDLRERGLSYANKIKFTEELAKYGRVFISSEGALPKELFSYRSSIGIDKMHHLMAFASLYIGESATMASECAVLGVPAIFIATTQRGYTTEQEKKYGLVFNFSDNEQEQAFDKMKELLAKHNLNKEWLRRRERMLSEKVDVTAWMVEFIERMHYRSEQDCSSNKVDR
jgi:predicted glycosyltransferase